MDNKQQTLTKERLNLQEEHAQHVNLKKSKNNKEIIIGSIIATILALTPFIFNMYKSVPDRKIWSTFLFTFNSQYYESALVFAWTFTGQFIPFLLLLIWFFTNRHWWYHALLVPISMYIYQMIETLNSDLLFSDENLIIYLLPVMAIIIPSIYLVRARIFYRINSVNKSIQDLEDELTFKPKSLWGKIKQYF